MKDGSAKTGRLEKRKLYTKRLLFNVIPPNIHFQLFADILTLFLMEPGIPRCWDSGISISTVLLNLSYSNLPSQLPKPVQKGEFKVHAKQGLKGVCACVYLTKHASLTEYDHVFKS